MSFSDFTISSACSLITIAAIAALSSSSAVRERSAWNGADGTICSRMVRLSAAARRTSPDLRNTGFILNSAKKEILHQRAEMRDQPLAGFREVGERRRVGDDFVPRAPVVAVALEPRRIGGHDRDI